MEIQFLVLAQVSNRRQQANDWSHGCHVWRQKRHHRICEDRKLGWKLVRFRIESIHAQNGWSNGLGDKFEYDIMGWICHHIARLGRQEYLICSRTFLSLYSKCWFYTLGILTRLVSISYKWRTKSVLRIWRLGWHLILQIWTRLHWNQGNIFDD